ncbi:hypothetical protein JCM8547_007185 [Rhodosporidiobolus lusitaniae]
MSDSSTRLPPLVLTLSFPSLSAFLASSSHLPQVSLAAQETDSLTVHIRTPPSLHSSPWASLRTRPPSTGASSSSSSSSSAPPPVPPSPVHLWLPLERALAQVYSTASQVFLKHRRVLATVDVVVDEMRGLPLCRPSDAESIHWQSDEGDDEHAQATEDDAGDQREGKGIYDVVALGGTFDHLHAGHKILLSMACAITQTKLIVGVSGDSLLKNKKYPELLESLEHRIRTVERFIELVRPSIAHEVVPLQDVYGPTAHDPSIEALVVSDETRQGGSTINDLRLSRNLNALDIHIINLVADDAEADEASKRGEPAVKVEAAAKMGSTGIREWIAKQKKQEADGRIDGREEGGEADLRDGK